MGYGLGHPLLMRRAFRGWLRLRESLLQGGWVNGPCLNCSHWEKAYVHCR